jgi:hypothetical protein
MDQQAQRASPAAGNEAEARIAALEQALAQRTAERDQAHQALHRRLLDTSQVPNAGGHTLISQLGAVVAELQRVATELEQRNTALAEANWTLERRVEERTAALRVAVTSFTVPVAVTPSAPVTPAATSSPLEVSVPPAAGASAAPTTTLAVSTGIPATFALSASTTPRALASPGAAWAVPANSSPATTAPTRVELTMDHFFCRTLIPRRRTPEARITQSYD